MSLDEHENPHVPTLWTAVSHPGNCKKYHEDMDLVRSMLKSGGKLRPPAAMCLLEERGGASQYTVLHLECMNCAVEVAKILIRNKADVNTRTRTGRHLCTTLYFDKDIKKSFNASSKVVRMFSQQP